MTLRPLTSHAELLAATAGDPLVRFELPHDFTGPAYSSGDAVVLVRLTHTGRRGLTFLGPDDAVLRLVQEVFATDLVATHQIGNLSVEQSVFGRVSSLVPLGRGNDWEWMHTASAPPAMAGEDRVEPLTEPERAEIQSLLDSANPRTDARPFQDDGQRWVGVRDRGRLVAIGCEESTRAGFPVLTGVTVDPVVRGTGLGLAVTAHLTRDAVERGGVCLLGMYSDNAVGRRLYLGVGYTVGHAFSSRALA